MAACTTHFALAMLVSAAAHKAKSAAPEVTRNAAFSTPSRGDGGRSGAELVACKRSCSPHLSLHLSSNEGNFPFEKSKTGLGEALVAGLSASLQRPLAPLRHLWLGGGSGLVLSGVALMAAQRTRAIAGGVCVRQMERADGGPIRSFAPEQSRN